MGVLEGVVHQERLDPIAQLHGFRNISKYKQIKAFFRSVVCTTRFA
jgi:hypothetical protein